MREYRERLRAGHKPATKEERAIARAAKVRELRGVDYTPLDELIAKPVVRLLRGLRFHDWITGPSLLDLCDVPPFDERDHLVRDAFTQALSRIVKRGLVERRDQLAPRREFTAMRQYEYRITEAGRAKLAALLKGKAL